jgi:hypothetical protein
MPQRSSQPPHRVALIVDENSNPFEMSCAIEVFGLRRPELGLTWLKLVHTSARLGDHFREACRRPAAGAV